MPTITPITKYIVVDDDDPRITYSGSDWFRDSGSKNESSAVTNGALHQGSVHATRSDGSISFTFEGFSVLVFGTAIKNTTETPAPTWQCSIDGNEISTNVNWTSSYNNALLCRNQITLATSQPHVLTINVTKPSPNSMFSLDYIRYVPSPAVSLDNAEIFVDQMDPSIDYDTYWRTNYSFMTTSQGGATLRYKFIGTSVSWYASMPSAKVNPGIATYSIDGGDPTSFSWTSDPYRTLGHQLLFSTPSLEPGPHDMVVTYLGSEGASPLALDFLVVKNGSTPASTSKPNQSTRTPIGAIVGGTIGAVVGLATIACLLLFWRQWKKCRQVELVGGLTVEPFVGQYQEEQLSSQESKHRPFDGGQGIPVSPAAHSSTTARRDTPPSAHSYTRYESGSQFHHAQEPPPNYTPTEYS